VKTQIAALAAIVLTAAVLVAPAAAARKPSAAPPSQAALAKRVTTLEKKVTALTKQVTTLQRIAGASLAYTECSIGATADAFAGTWSVVDQVAQATQARTYFGAQPVVSDFNACAAFNINRNPAVPPNLSVFSALTALLR
jgi:hypothetical protein